MKYTGPAKPIPTQREFMPHKGSRVAFLLLVIVTAAFLYLG